MSTTNTSLQELQVQLTVFNLAITTFSAARLPEISEFLFRRWSSYGTIKSALVWVPFVATDFVTLLQDLHKFTNAGALFDQGITTLFDAAQRCLVLLRVLQIRDSYNRSFFPWNTWSGRSSFVIEVEAAIKRVEEAYWTCEFWARKLLDQNPQIIFTEKDTVAAV